MKSPVIFMMGYGTMGTGALQATVGVATAIWYGWLATPHNAYRSNSRFHWVDFITFYS